MSNLKILIVEDESLIALELSDSIKKLGFDVIDYVTNTKAAKQVLSEHTNINLIIIDINLNTSLDGIDFYISLATQIPVIYLSAYKDAQIISKAVQTNPLGYLIKPHNENELFALLKLLEYKINSNFHMPKETHLVELGFGYFFDTEDDKLFFNEVHINLGTKELKLLKLLIDAKSQIVTFRTIEEEVWRDERMSESSLRTLIYRLRGKLEYKLIQTEFNLGIKLEVQKA